MYYNRTLSEIKQLAEQAGNLEWCYDPESRIVMAYDPNGIADTSFSGVATADFLIDDHSEGFFIAAANPVVVAKLVERIELLQGWLTVARDAMRKEGDVLPASGMREIDMALKECD